MIEFLDFDVDYKGLCGMDKVLFIDDVLIFKDVCWRLVWFLIWEYCYVFVFYWKVECMIKVYYYLEMLWWLNICGYLNMCKSGLNFL